MTAFSSLAPPPAERSSTGEPLRPTRVAPSVQGRRRRKARALLASQGANALGLQIARISRHPRGSATLVARFPHPLAAGLGPLLSALSARALEVRRLESVPSASALSARETIGRTARAAATWGAATGVVGAVLGAVVVDGDALLPRFGWLPGPLVGALLGAGLFGALGVLLGALALLLLPPLATSGAARDAAIVVVRTRPFDLDAVVTAIVDAGGSIAALGEE